MTHANQQYKYPQNNTPSVIGGMLVGALAGAVTMLLLAPQSGKDTRKQIQEKGIEFRDRTTEMLEDTIAQVRSKANQTATDVKDYGQDLAVEQLENVSDAAQTGKKVIQSS